ncbi:WXG100 family type VII secretion target [Streptomyces sp. NPDC092307]|uniref:WXG100 family type VII secretion target n=1 Tax=Streptomyces sp. NPDC092307 TaxID=3366013 RepID=UPI0038163D3A
MTDFEHFTHQQMRDMITSLDPTSVRARADQLASAAEKIKAIGEVLKRHVVTGWEGEGADAFQEWVGRAGNATLRLSEYSAKGGEWMGKVVQTMTEATKMVAVDSTATKNLAAAMEHHNDPDAAAVRAEAQTTLDADRREAIRLMTNLAQSYQQSSTEMDKAPIPTFPPPPKVLLPATVDGTSDMARTGSSSGTASHAASPTSASSTHGGTAGSLDEPGWDVGPRPQPDNTLPTTTLPAPVTPDRDVEVDLDTVGTLPPSQTLPPVTTTPGSPLPTGPVGLTPGPVLPPVGFPPVGGMKPPGLAGPGIGPYPGLGGPGMPPPGGKVLGTPGLPARDSGIMGGRPVNSTGPSSGIPRGTVIGEGAQTGRPMGGGGMGHGGGGAHGIQGGLPAGRRLASEPGGVVGGRQAGAGGRPVSGGQPFTQGGSGLVRNGSGGGAGMGAMGHAGAGTQTPGKRRDDQGGERPDYLAEDEETWQGSRRVVPPVID